MKKMSFVLLLAVAGFAVQAQGISLHPLNAGEIMLQDSFYRTWQGKALTPGTFTKVGSHRFAMTAKSGLKTPAQAEIFREFKDFDCEGFDRVIFFMRPHARYSAQLLVTTDAGIKKSPVLTTKNTNTPLELNSDISGAKKIKKVTVRFKADKSGGGRWSAALYFLALRDSEGFKKHLKYLDNFRRINLDTLLVPKDSEFSFKGSLNIIFAKGQLDKFREFVMKDPVLKNRVNLVAAGIRKMNPQDHYDISIPCSYTPREHTRRRKIGNMATAGVFAAYCGVLLKDKELLRKAAECALVIASYDTWNESYWRRKSSWHASAVFRDADAAMAAVAILDLAGEALNIKGRGTVLRALEEKGFNNITYSLWARPCGHGNQAVVFLSGKIAALLAFEKSWQGVDRYTKLSFDELTESMNHIFYRDGAYAESTGYLDYAIHCAVRPYLFYSNAKDLPFKKIMPKNIAKSPAFGHLIYSTSKNPKRNQVALGQTNTLSMLPESALFLSGACPGSIWERFIPEEIIPLRQKQIFPYGSVTDLWRLRQKVKISGKYPDLQEFTSLKSIGCVNSFRKTASGGISKILFTGYAKMGKREQDIGNFIFEYNGDAFADTLTSRQANYYAMCQWRNMLVPGGTKAIAQPTKYTTLLRKKMKFIPNASGGKKSFRATIDNLGDSWDNKYLKKWSRTIESPNPENITVIDDYILGNAATGADFFWITTLPAAVKGNKVVITGDYGSTCELSWNSPCTASVERFKPSAPVYKGMFIDSKRKFSRIRIHSKARQGKIIVKVRFIPAAK